MAKDVKKAPVEAIRPSEKFDGFVRMTEDSNLRYYKERLAELEARVFKLEERIRQIEHILMLGRS